MILNGMELNWLDEDTGRQANVFILNGAPEAPHKWGFFVLDKDGGIVSKTDFGFDSAEAAADRAEVLARELLSAPSGA